MPSLTQHSNSGVNVHVPTITQEDLTKYNALHFPTARAPASLSHAYNQYMNHDDDGLGFYDDGNKRTITGDQIAMFRHTEIQALLRERRLCEEAEVDDELTSSADLLLQTEEDVQPDNKEDVQPDKEESAHQDIAIEDCSSAEEQSEGPSNLSRNQRRKMNIKQAKLDRRAEEKTNRRLARESDEALEEHVELDY